MSRSLARIIPQILRNDVLESPFRRWGLAPFGRSGSGMDFFDREINRMENLMTRMQNEMWRNADVFAPSRTPEYFSAGQNIFKIVEENGKQKMRVQFQAENCKPDDIEVKTKGNQLEIRAKQEETGKHFTSYHEYTQMFTLPEGIKAEELTCKFDDGLVILEAPYTPRAVEASETKELPVEHQQTEPVRKDIQIKHEK